MLWAIALILLVLWLIGLLGSLGGAWIHILLLLSVIIIAYNWAVSRRKHKVI
jgi:hypothetical protein